MAPGFSDERADSSDRGAEILFSGYYECQKSPKNGFHLPKGASMFRRGTKSP